ncbi:MAG: CoA-binding protein [Candidatus Bathyarchaeota archaeon]|nr:CoA-binding protein [Candidatus Bathyarchaeum sp.]
MSQKEIKSVLESYRTVAVVGLSRNPVKASHKVARYLQSVGYRVIPVNPFVDKLLGESSYKSLLDIPEKVDIIDIFRPSGDVSTLVDEAITLKKKVGSPKVIWMQLGIVNEDAARRAKEAGFTVVMDRCIMMEHKRLSMEDVLER